MSFNYFFDCLFSTLEKSLKETDIDFFLIFRIANISEPILVESGQDALFECVFSSNPVMYDGITWLRHDRHNDAEVSVTDTDRRRFSQDWDDIGGNMVRARLIVRNVSVADAGKIFCAVSNGYGAEARSETFLLVKRKFISTLINFLLDLNTNPL